MIACKLFVGCVAFAVLAIDAAPAPTFSTYPIVYTSAGQAGSSAQSSGFAYHASSGQGMLSSNAASTEEAVGHSQNGATTFQLVHGSSNYGDGSALNNASSNGQTATTLMAETSPDCDTGNLEELERNLNNGGGETTNTTTKTIEVSANGATNLNVAHESQLRQQQELALAQQQELHHQQQLLLAHSATVPSAVIPSAPPKVIQSGHTATTLIAGNPAYVAHRVEEIGGNLNNVGGTTNAVRTIQVNVNGATNFATAQHESQIRQQQALARQQELRRQQQLLLAHSAAVPSVVVPSVISSAPIHHASNSAHTATTTLIAGEPDCVTGNVQEVGGNLNHVRGTTNATMQTIHFNASGANLAAAQQELARRNQQELAQQQLKQQLKTQQMLLAESREPRLVAKTVTKYDYASSNAFQQNAAAKSFQTISVGR